MSKRLATLSATAVATTALLAFGIGGVPAGSQTVEPVVVQFTTVGATTFTVPADTCEITVDALGASGGNVGGGPLTAGGEGGEAVATFAVTPGDVLQVNVGGAGEDAQAFSGGAGGFNGGADGGDSDANTGVSAAAGGGGASDVRSGAFGLADRVVVAGGGGGSANLGGADGGDGGGVNGDDGLDVGTDGAGLGGTQTAGGAGGVGTINGSGGAFGAGGAGAGSSAFMDGLRAGGGGGGGWYGGGGGAGSDGVDFSQGGAGGGSGHTPDGSGLTTGGNTGDGQVTISYTPGTGCPAVVPTPDPEPEAAPAVVLLPTFTG